jgi:hypothetical protein
MLVAVAVAVVVRVVLLLAAAVLDLLTTEMVRWVLLIPAVAVVVPLAIMLVVLKQVEQEALVL